MRTFARGLAALLTLPALAAVPTPSYAAADPDPAADAADWLAAHVPTSGRELRIDVALALVDVGDHASTVSAIRDQLAATADADTAGSAAASAHTVLLAAETGDDPTDFGGVDLVARVEALTDSAGRASTDTATQAMAVQAFEIGGSDRLGDATADLLARQCRDGSFPAIVSAACGNAGTEATVPTARAVLALVGQDDDARVHDSLRDAMNWLLQSLDEGVVDATTSIAWAARALAALGEEAAAEAEAAQVRARQLTDVGTCNYYRADDEGAVAEDAPGDIGEEDLAAYQHATAMALPALGWAPARTGAPRAFLPSGYVAAEAMQPFRIDTLAPGEALCLVASQPLQRVLVHADATGAYESMVFGPPDGESFELSAATVDGTLATVQLRGLGAKSLPVSLRKQVAKGATQAVRVTGLAAGEKVTVKVDGKRVARGKASSTGTFATSFRVTGSPRTATVVVRSEVPDRTGSRTFRVVR